MSIKAMVLLSVPSLFMIDGRANVLSKRLGLDDGGDPPFFAFVALGDNSLEFGFGADYKVPKESGSIFSLYAEVQAAFFFNDNSKWYVNFGTKTNPITARVLTLITLKSFLMLSAKGIEAGARGEYVFNKTYGPVKIAAWAYVEVGGKISFQGPQMGAYMAAGVGANINIRILRLYVSLDILFGVEAPKPFKIYGKFRLCVRVKILFIKIRFCGNVELSWEFNRTIDKTPINPLIANSGDSRLNDAVKGVHMLTNETFDLAYIPGGTIPGSPTDQIRNTIIPLDTYIDIKSEKGLLPGAVSHLIGGVNNPATRYTDLMPPDAEVRGKHMRQVKHQYVVDSIVIKAWNGSAWVDYHPYKAMYPNETSGVFNNLKIGQWQKADGQYNAIRLLATTPFSYTEQGEPGWFVPEQYGVTASTLFCEGQTIEKHCATFRNKPLRHRYYCYDRNNHFFYADNVSFMLLNSRDDEYAEVVSTSNVFDIDQSLAFENSNTLQIILPQPSYEVDLRVSNGYHGVKVKYYAAITQANAYAVQYGHPDTGLTPSQRTFPYEVIVPVGDLSEPIRFSLADHAGWDAIARIEVEPYFSEATGSLIASLRDQIEAIERYNWQILLGEIQGNPQSAASLEAQLNGLLQGGGIVIRERYRFNSEDNLHTLTVNGRDIAYTGTWDWRIDGKFHENPFGFKRLDKIVIESDFKIIHVKPLAIIQKDNDTEERLVIPAGSYTVEYDNKKAYIGLAFEYWDWDVVELEIDYYKEGNCCGTQQSFINRYVRGTHQYTDSVQIGNFIYAVGFLAERSGNLGLITKTSLDGNVVWQKIYQGSGDSLIFGSVIQCDNADLMIVAHTANDYKWLLYRISPSGDIIWKKRYADPVEPAAGVTVEALKLTGENYALIVQVTGSGAGDGVQFLRINGSGQVRVSKRLEDPDGLMAVADSLSYGNKIIVIGNQFSDVHGTNVGSIAVLDNDFNLIDKFGLIAHSNDKQLVLNSAAVQNNQLVLSGTIFTVTYVDDKDGRDGADPGNPYVLDGGIVSVTKIDLSQNRPETGDQEITVIYHDYKVSVNRVNCNSQSIYLNYFWNHYAKLDSNMNVVWVKALPLTVDRVTGERALLHGSLLSPDNKAFNGVLGSADLELRSCKTKPVNEFGVYTAKAVRVSDFSFVLTATDRSGAAVAFLENYEIRNKFPAKEGICACSCDNQEDSGKTLLHEVCWLTREDYAYNINIPGQDAISEDAFATVAGITQFIQPIWRPDTSYLVHFKLKDIVDGNSPRSYPFTYGFSTAGPVGFFHTHPQANYGDLLHPDKYPLTSLRQYIDYQRSYPNADGNLLGAKPLFYDDDVHTNIALYFTKAYATHFFKEWNANPALGLGQIKGQMKIVIKDPREDISIINPPALNGIVTTVDIPQTEEAWTEDNAPLVPFALSQWINLFMADEHCIFTDKPEVIKPASKYLSVKLHKLKPQKLYTALVNNIYDSNKDGILGPVPGTNDPAIQEQVAETRQVHSFVFQTSRYRNFREQVESYVLFDGEGDARVERKAFFGISKAITDVELTVLWKTMNGESIANLLPSAETDALLSNYLHLFDRAMEGLLKISPVNAAISTEINFITNTESGNVVALLVRNPEPFNNPKMPLEAVADTLVVLTGGNPDASYKVLHSKDYAQALIMPENKIVPQTGLGLRFKYKSWDGSQYAVNVDNPNDTVVVEAITTNLQN
jgi:hypothetical protein